MRARRLGQPCHLPAAVLHGPVEGLTQRSGLSPAKCERNSRYRSVGYRIQHSGHFNCLFCPAQLCQGMLCTRRRQWTSKSCFAWNQKPINVIGLDHTAAIEVPLCCASFVLGGRMYVGMHRCSTGVR